MTLITSKKITTVACQSTYYMNKYYMSTGLKCAMSALKAACDSTWMLLPTPDAFLSEAVLSCYLAFSLAFYPAYLLAFCLAYLLAFYLA